MRRGRLRATTRTIRRTAVAVIGTTILLLGVALIALPGPAIVVIPIGLAILGLEFAWARRWMRTLRARARAQDRSASAASESAGFVSQPVPTREGPASAANDVS